MNRDKLLALRDAAARACTAAEQNTLAGKLGLLPSPEQLHAPFHWIVAVGEAREVLTRALAGERRGTPAYSHLGEALSAVGMVTSTLGELIEQALRSGR